jgi:hypothetical protein
MFDKLWLGSAGCPKLLEQQEAEVKTIFHFQDSVLVAGNQYRGFHYQQI